MKILVVLRDTNIGGGVTAAAVSFCNELSRKGHEVVHLDLMGDNFCDDRLDKEIKRGFLINNSRYWNLSKKELKEAKGFLKIKLFFLGIIKKITNKSSLWCKLIFKRYKQFGDFDVAIAFRQCSPCYSFVLNKVKAKTKIGFIHGEIKEMGDVSSWSKYMEKFDVIACVSDSVKEGFAREFPKIKEKFKTVHNMVDTNYICKQAIQEPEIHFDKNKIIIVTVSRIDNKQKGTDRITRLCSRLKEEGITNFSWYVIGGGADKKTCMEEAKSLGVSGILHFLGEMKNPYPYIKQSNFTILPTRGESFGLVVVESLILHKPVVVCEYPALKEIFQDGVLGVVAKQDDESLYLAVKEMIVNKTKREEITSNCLDYEYSNENAYNQFMEAVS